MARVLRLAGLAAVVFALHAGSAHANCPTALLAADQVCIDQPPVNAALTPNVPGAPTFAPGTWIKLRADGCAGGVSDGWKRYVDPDPEDNGDNTAHGEAAIVPVSAGSNTLPLTEFLSINPNTRYRVPVASHLELGYEDTDYSNNGYTGHSDGFHGQCQETTARPAGYFGPDGLLYGKDGYGGPAFVVLTVDPDSPPSVTATGPGTPVTGTTTLSASASDPDGDAISYTYLIDGAVVAGPTSLASTSWNTATVADGGHSLVVRATDSWSQSHDSAARPFVVDNHAPSVTITDGPDGQTFGPNDQLTWRFTANDGTGSGVKNLLCGVDQNVPVACNGGSFTTTVASGGAHTFSVQAVDNVNLASAAATRSFTIDTSAPDTTIADGPPDGYAAAASETLRYLLSSDPGATFRCRVYVDSPALAKPPFGACTGTDFEVISGLSAGSYVFEAFATDMAGNADPTPASRRFSFAAPVVPTPTPGPLPTPVPTPVPLPVVHKLHIPATLRYAYTSATKLTKLQVMHVPKGSTVRVTCHGRGCPRALRKPYTKKRVSGTVSLTAFIKRAFRPHDRLTIVVSNAAWLPVTKTVTFRAGKAPLVS